jgi:16S rRNA (guanine(966)-N(2))-methyltransferase RsmD
VRIVAGAYRGRWIEVADLPGLRPTPNRVRETLFNWLGQRLDGWSCLDLFAGSGALGFEAASRGAAGVTMVESDRGAAAMLLDNRRRLGATVCTVVRADALAYLRGCKDRFDLVCLDPPFGTALLGAALHAVADHVKPTGLVYCEWGEPLENVATDVSAWRIVRSGRAGVVHFGLLAKRGNGVTAYDQVRVSGDF